MTPPNIAPRVLLAGSLLAAVLACSQSDHYVGRDIEPPRNCAPLRLCSGVCVDTTSNRDHCGVCGRRCAFDERCVASVCRGSRPDTGVPDAGPELEPDATEPDATEPDPTPPRLEVTPTEINLGKLAVGTRLSRRVTITNGADGGEYLRLGSVGDGGLWTDSLPTLGNSVNFQVSAPAPFPEAGLAPGESWELSVVFTPTAGGELKTTLRVCSNALEQPCVDVELSVDARTLEPCEAEVVPDSLDFGTVSPGASAKRVVKIRNRGRKECLLRVIGFAAGSDSAFRADLDPSGVLLASGTEPFELPVHFEPTVEIASASGELNLYLSNPTSPQRSIQLSGSSGRVCLVADPASLNLGEVQLGCKPASRTVVVKNQCTSAITIEKIDVHHDSSSRLELTNPPALPHSLAANAELPLEILYTPSAQLMEVADLTLRAAPPANERLVVAVAGSGRHNYREEWVTLRAVDVLFIVDDSASMTFGSRISGFATHMPDAIMRRATDLKADMHVAATTTSVCAGDAGCDYANGRFLPLDGSLPRVVTHETADAGTILGQNLTLTTAGSNQEQPALALQRALSPELLETINKGFLRDWASLAVVVLSDNELEQGDDAQGSRICRALDVVPAAQAVKRLTPTSTRPRANSVSTVFLMPPAHPVCEWTNGPGALRVDPAPNWSQVLSQALNEVFRHLLRAYLSEQPDLSFSPPVTVTVDGFPLDEVGNYGARNWTYEPDSNSIRFPDLNAPEEHSKVMVSYRVSCPSE